MNIFKNAFSTAIILTLSLTLLQAQPNNSNQSGKSYSGGSTDNKERFTVNNFSYVKKFSPKGDGDFLEVIFDVNNMTDGELKMRFFIVGFHEKNAIQRLARLWKGYPNWRKKDFEAEDYSIPFHDVIPKIETDISKADKDNRYEDSDFLTLIQLVERNPDKGVDFLVMGVNPSLASKDRIKFGKDNDYIVTMDRLKTTVTAKLFSKYRADAKFFNHFGLILVDDTNKKVVYRQFMKFNRRFKIR